MKRLMFKGVESKRADVEALCQMAEFETRESWGKNRSAPNVTVSSDLLWTICRDWLNATEGE